MSVFGGDSWAREAQYRKRRVDDLVLQGIDASAYRKLPSGKFLCLICPHRPVLDTPLLLTTHVKGSRHQAADSKLKERELDRKFEINKRIALADSSDTPSGRTSTCGRTHLTAKKPLIGLAQKAASEILCAESSVRDSTVYESYVDVGSNTPHYKGIPFTQNNYSTGVSRASGEGISQHLDSRERHERELKFTAAGWKRDGYGRWFKDENVEFDSDEEDPNVCL